MRKGEAFTSPHAENQPIFSDPADEARLKAFIDRYLRLLFGFCLSYGAYTREQAFQLTVSSFAETLRTADLSGGNSVFLTALFTRALDECGKTTPSGTPGLEAFGHLPSNQQPSLEIVREALMHLSSDDRAVLLLRDQCHLPFDGIAGVMGSNVHEVRSACLAGRERLRAKVQELLNVMEQNNGM